ncbi:hypothetical protein [Cytobacillus firmus]|uniref:hypothetical protein n=1 Tax=Cytobacillus firmus TaxID=1399 RepID=UPI0024C2021C|nr:hypothetical protein [Cytobacillus firmus]WHY63273.1 hypothetical protein QNH42_07910 [Cytobacillus firmus]
MNLEVVLNTYERKARYLPAVWTVSPILIWLYLWFPEIRSLEGTFISLIIGLGISIPLSILARTLGKKEQNKLLLKWGALPATLILRNSDESLNKETKTRYHQRLSVLTNMDIPSHEKELEDPKDALQKFDSCIDFLRQRTRDKAKYSLVFNENVSYGQARNLLGLKPIGLLICVILIAIQFFSIYKNYGIGFNISAVQILETISFIITLLFLLFWIFFVSTKQVYTAGVNYGKALLECCEHFE